MLAKTRGLVFLIAGIAMISIAATFLSLSYAKIVNIHKEPYNASVVLRCGWGIGRNQLGYEVAHERGDGFYEPAAGPKAFAVDKDGNVYITDTEKGRIMKFSGSGMLLSTFGWQEIQGKEFTSVMRTSGRDIRLESISRSWYPSLPATYLRQPTDVVVDGDGNIYVRDLYYPDFVFKFNPSGMLVAIVDSFGPYDHSQIDMIYFKPAEKGNFYIKVGVKGETLMKYLKFGPSGVFLGEGLVWESAQGETYKTRKAMVDKIQSGRVKEEFVVGITESNGLSRRLTINFSAACIWLMANRC